jgi:cyclopropane fatty-acyl-phospholipid synthase-like methyltransferase
MLTSEAVQPFTVLHLGCGRKKTLDALGLKLAMNGEPLDPSRVRMINLDRLADVDPDIRCELSTDRIDLPDNSVDAVLAMHVLEHIGRQGEIEGWFHFWAELYRVMKPNAFVRFECPHSNSVWAWADPTHVRAINEYVFLYLNQEAYASPGSAIPDYRPNFDFVLVKRENIPDHTNPENTEPIAFIRGTLVARKPLVRYWEPVL